MRDDPKVGEYYFFINPINGQVLQIEKILELYSNDKFKYKASYINGIDHIGLGHFPLSSNYVKIHSILVKLWRLDE